MASPISLYVVPNCGLDIEFDFNLKAVFGDWKTSSRLRSSRKPLTYRVARKSGDFLPGSATSVISGVCSPISEVTLPEAVKTMAGIPSEGKYYCYLHPPPNFAQEIDWKTFQCNWKKFEDENDPLDLNTGETNNWAIPCIALLGGFVYLDKHFDILTINALSLMKTDYDFKLSGPFTPTDAAIKEVRRSGRAHHVPLEYCFEVGFVAYAWIRPNEKFHYKKAIEKFHNDHGCAIFYREDGSAVSYALDPSGYINPEGECCSLANVFQSTRETACNSYIKTSIGFLTGYRFPTEAEVSETRVEIERMSGTIAKQNFLHSLGDTRTLIHEACKAGCEIGTIERHLDENEVANLDHQDIFGCTPLHYACRHHPRNDALINLLIENCNKAVVMKDRFNRYPLHIACDSNASSNVIAALIRADQAKTTILQKTKFGGRLPILIACYKKLSKESMKCLLEADSLSETLTTKSNAGRLPLHMAIEQKLPTDVIKLLLENNAGERYESSHHTENAIERTFSQDHASNGKLAIYKTFEDMLPLHIACWKNSSKETIEILLNADDANRTVKTPVGPNSFLMQNRDDFLDDEKHGSNQSKKSLTDKDSDSAYTEDDVSVESRDQCSVRIFPLHLAARHGSPEVMNLLLKKEKLPERISTGNQPCSIEFRDIHGMTPLHITCCYCNDPTIIEDLLEMDENGRTTQMDDKWKNKPIHCKSY